MSSSYLTNRVNYTRKGKDAANDVDKVFKYLCSMENDVIRPRTISIRGRNVTFRKTCGQVLDSTFEELCDRVSCLREVHVRITLINI